ncbi:MAG: shikimate dehydrogenase [Melioribacteraceae bacterium]|nr:MAG: shikimate dehydrogenase [Melioribacteraceae bacterium]
MHFSKKYSPAANIVGVIGHPIKQSLSPLMHNFAFESLESDYIYLPFDVPLSNLKDALKGMLALNIQGFNVTLPLKEKIGEYLHDISEEASVIGAVNTVVNENGTLRGYNTDVFGIIETLSPYQEELSGSIVTVIGGGGAARSVIYALIRHFKVASINIVNRTAQKAESLKDYFTEKMLFGEFKAYDLVPPDLVDVFKNSKFIINTTSIGMYPDYDDSATEIADSFNDSQVVFDVIYNPLKTRLLEIAEARGAVTINGLKMFVEQGARAFELWTGEKMPVDSVYDLLEKELLDMKR